MIDKYKIVCNTAAGRRRYMQYLIPFVVSNDIVDRYDIWINTTNKQDIAFFEILSKKFSKIQLVYQPEGIVNGNASINAFYKHCVEDETIYFKLDDDIIWMESDAIEKMVRFRIDNPEYFIVSPLVINNALCTYILQNKNKIQLSEYRGARANDDVLWKSGDFAVQLHNWFLTTQLLKKQYENLHCGFHPIAINRFSINAILWFGKEMKKFSGNVPGNDEEWLSVIKPTELRAVNCINGNVIVSHFAFYTQREILDRKNILERYGKYLHKEWEKNSFMHTIDETVQNAMNEVEKDKEMILAKSDIYSTPYRKTGLKNILANWKVPLFKLYTLSQIKSELLQKRGVYIKNK